MNSRPDAVQFARWSYYLSYVTSGILLLAFILNMARTPLGAIVWLAFVTSAVGAFMGWAARRDFKVRPADQKVMQMAKQGFRTNVLGFICLIIMFVIFLIIRGMMSQGTVPTGQILNLNNWFNL
jgi:hypothetical protein